METRWPRGYTKGLTKSFQKLQKLMLLCNKRIHLQLSRDYNSFSHYIFSSLTEPKGTAINMWGL
jgi:hypothetical protein